MAAAELKDIYIGDVHKQLRDGYGVYTYENKFFQYEGEWVNGKKHGHGKFSMADGSYYEGQFVGGEIDGHGFKYFASSQNVYSGEFAGGELHGQGVMTYADGSTYEGEWQHNKRVGYGIFMSSDGSVYQGSYHDNKRHGQGILTYKNVESYDGNWVCDRRQGHGEWRTSNGDIYVGQWQNDLYNGQGKLTMFSGAMYEGLWINGQPACSAVRLVISGVENPLSLMPGESFTICVECQDDEGQVMEDNGRKIELIAGVRSVETKTKTKSTDSKLPNSESTTMAVTTIEESLGHSTREISGQSFGNSSGHLDKVPVLPTESSNRLFDAIEDVEEQPIETPLGYRIVRYPLSVRQSMDDSLPADYRLSTAVESMKSGMPVGVIQATFTVEGASDINASQAVSSQQDSHLRVNSGLTAPGSAVEMAKVESNSDSQIFVPVPTVCTKAGRVSFRDLVLPPAPPLYRPFQMQDAPAGHSSSMASQAKPPPSSNPSQTSFNNTFARPGEYVILARDVTSPAFLDVTLQPAALIVNVGVKKSSSALGKKSRSQISVKSSSSKSIVA
jgi:hypothetical protein